MKVWFKEYENEVPAKRENWEVRIPDKNRANANNYKNQNLNP